jgi:predicted RNase H-like HicB family nuclease
MFKVKPYPAILEKTKKGYSVYFPDLPGAVSAGNTYEKTIQNGKECLSLHLHGMMEDNEKLPEPRHISSLIEEIEEGDLIALIEPDILSVLSAKQKDKKISIKVPIYTSLVKALDFRAYTLGVNRSFLLEEAIREIVTNK